MDIFKNIIGFIKKVTEPLKARENLEERLSNFSVSIVSGDGLAPLNAS